MRDLLVVACGIFSCSVWDLVPWPGIKTGPPALGAHSLSQWTTREIPRVLLYESNLYEVQGQVKLIIVIEARIEIAWEKGMALTGKGHERVYWGNGKVLYLYLNSVCMSIYICQNLIGLSILLTYTAVWKIQTYLLWHFRRVLAAVIGCFRVALIFSKPNYSLSPSLKIKRQYIYHRTLLTTGKNFT